MSQSNWSIQTRLLHVGMAITVSFQLAISMIMEPPDEEVASQMAKAAYEAHELVGMAALLIVLAHWLWSLSSQVDGGFKHLFPWTGTALAEVKNDVGQLIQGGLPEGGSRGGLPGLVHGLGFLVVTGMVITGGIIFFTFPETGKPGETAHLFAEFHEAIASLVWIYWIGHVGLGFAHKLKGHNTVKDMFSIK